jgi:hypothetical protein
MLAVQIFVSAAIILGDGLYNLIKISVITGQHLYRTYKSSRQLPSYTTSASPDAGNQHSPLACTSANGQREFLPLEF